MPPCPHLTLSVVFACDFSLCVRCNAPNVHAYSQPIRNVPQAIRFAYTLMLAPTGKFDGFSLYGYADDSGLFFSRYCVNSKLFAGVRVPPTHL